MARKATPKVDADGNVVAPREVKPRPAYVAYRVFDASGNNITKMVTVAVEEVTRKSDDVLAVIDNANSAGDPLSYMRFTIK